MNDMLMVGVAVAVVLGGLLAFAFYHIYGGVHASLANAKVGEVYNFVYEQPLHGSRERFLARVVEPVYTLSDDQIRRLNTRSYYRSNDPQFKRTRHLVTCETPDGTVRNFYAERATQCRKPLLGSSLFKAGVANLF